MNKALISIILLISAFTAQAATMSMSVAGSFPLTCDQKFTFASAADLQINALSNVAQISQPDASGSFQINGQEGVAISVQGSTTTCAAFCKTDTHCLSDCKGSVIGNGIAKDKGQIIVQCFGAQGPAAVFSMQDTL